MRISTSLLLLSFTSFVFCACVLGSNLVASGAEKVAATCAGGSAEGARSGGCATDCTLSNRPNSSEMEAVDAAKKNMGDFSSGPTVPAAAVGEVTAGAQVVEDSRIPERYVIGCNGDRAEAARRCEKQGYFPCAILPHSTATTTPTVPLWYDCIVYRSSGSKLFDFCGAFVPGWCGCFC